MSTKNYRILIVDDAPEFHKDIRYAFRKTFVFEGALSTSALKKKLNDDDKFDLILLDLVLDKSKEKVGFGLIDFVVEHYPEIPIIVVTADHKIATAVEAMKRGAKNFLPKDNYDHNYWKKTFVEAIEGQKNKKENKALRAEIKEIKAQMGYRNPPGYPFIGNSPQMNLLRRSLKNVGNYEEDPDLTVLITGETGVGKGMAARFLHFNSELRREHPFEEIHISNITESLLESTLFGAKKGTYTDAKEDVIGRFQLADKGVLFLDEVGDLNARSQLKLLEFLNNKTIHPLGMIKGVVLDVQIVAATNKNLEEEVKKGNFRIDLYHRIKVVHYEIPPLRERREDIVDLLLHFLRLDRVNQLQDVLTEKVQRRLLYEYPWPGNVRELENAISSARFQQKMTYKTEKIDWQCIPREIRIHEEGSVYVGSSAIDAIPEYSIPAINTLDLNFAEQNAFNTLKSIDQALLRMNGVKKDVAEMLNIKSSDSLRYLIKKHFEKHPHLFTHFSEIKKRFPNIVTDEN